MVTLRQARERREAASEIISALLVLGKHSARYDASMLRLFTKADCDPQLILRGLDLASRITADLRAARGGQAVDDLWGSR